MPQKSSECSHTCICHIQHSLSWEIASVCTYNILCCERLHTYAPLNIRSHQNRKIAHPPHITFLVIRDKVRNSFSSEITCAISNTTSYKQHSLASRNTYITCNAVLRLFSIDFVWSHIWHYGCMHRLIINKGFKLMNTLHATKCIIENGHKLKTLGESIYASKHMIASKGSITTKL